MELKNNSAPEVRSEQGLMARLADLLWGPSGPPKNLDGSALAVDRTRLAFQRTMMAWIRTGLSMISFGFTIYKFFDVQAGLGPLREGLVSPRAFGFMMILTGLCAVLFGGLEHRREMRSLRSAGVHIPPSLANIVGALVFLLGVLGLPAVVFRR
jgi:putative membrane protein